jgi:hypothetical protein
MALGKPVGIGRKKEIELDTAASHLIEECRMVIPGIQALFGFQLIAIFNEGFDKKLAAPVQVVHLVALILTALSMALVMTPAAIHRIAEPMSVSERFLWMASNLLLAGMVSLAIGVALDVFVVTTALSSNRTMGLAVGIGALLVFFVFWLVLPRRERDRHR